MKELINKVAEATGETKVLSDKMIKATISALQEQLIENKKFTLQGFGTFNIKGKPQRMGRNPMTGEEILIPPKNSLSFKISASYKERINE